MEPRSAKVGVGVLVWKGNKIALVKRAGPYGNGTWSPPGGHVEFGECVSETARRETMEKIGVKIENLGNPGIHRGYNTGQALHNCMDPCGLGIR